MCAGGMTALSTWAARQLASMSSQIDACASSCQTIITQQEPHEATVVYMSWMRNSTMQAQQQM